MIFQLFFKYQIIYKMLIYLTFSSYPRGSQSVGRDTWGVRENFIGGKGRGHK